MSHILAEQDFVVSGFTFLRGKLLLISHKKLQTLLPPGGHIELGELPDDALKREMEEETGLRHGIDYSYISPEGSMRLGHDNPEVLRGRITPQYAPWAVEQHLFDPVPGHKHLCLIYLLHAYLSAWHVNAPGDDGVESVGWYTADEIGNMGRDRIWPSVKEYSLAALEISKGYS